MQVTIQGLCFTKHWSGPGLMLVSSNLLKFMQDSGASSIHVTGVDTETHRTHSVWGLSHSLALS